MTAQTAEVLRLDGEELPLCTTPLGDYFEMGGADPGFRWTSTSCWRGYVGQWEIRDDRLYLIGLEGTLKDWSTAGLGHVFPDYPDRVFAHWYSGTLRATQGSMLEYVHMGFASVCERDLLIEVDKGIVKGRRVRHNSFLVDEALAEGYQVGGETVIGPAAAQKEEGQ